MASTADIVDVTIKAMRTAAEGGSASALEELRRLTTVPAGLAAAPPSGAATPAAPAAPGTLESPDKIIKRPNGADYHVRKLGKHDDVMVLRRAREQGIPVLTYGPPGTGKTAMVEAAFGEIETIQGTGDTDVLEFVGSFIQLPNGMYDWVDGPLLRAMDKGCPLYVDEAALIDPKVMSVCYSVMDGRGELNVTQNPARGTVKAEDGFYVVASTNPNAPGARMSEALLSRFRIQFLVKTDYDLAKKLGVPVNVVGAAKNLQVKQEKEGVISWSPQLRELLGYLENERNFGAEMALGNLISQAPEQDRKVVAEVLTKRFGKEIKELALS